MPPHPTASEAVARLCLNVLSDKKAENPVALDVRELCSYADMLVIAGGNSTRHVSAMAQAVIEALKTAGHRPGGVEGLSSALWALVDVGDVVVHIFHCPVREYYDIEGLWYNAPRFL